MGRWRPPPPRSSPYITAEGAARLRAELKALWKEQRPEVVRALAAAAAEGDRSENAEYTYRKKQLGEIDRRVRYLSKRLDVLKVVDAVPRDTSKIRFGAWVRYADAARTRTVRIVGADEIDASRGWISVDAPVARALLGHGAGDELAVETPEGALRLTVEAVSFTPMDD